MKVVILGGSGFIGTHLSEHLQELGHEVFIGTRSPEKVNSNYQALPWPLDSSQDYTHIEAVINLAGETINQRWTKQAKQRIINSRVETTKQLVGYIREGILRPHTVINGSAIGYYGSSTEGQLTEDSPTGNDFLAEVTRKWEKEADEVVPLGARLVKARTGVVLGKEGGALPNMLLPYKLYAGGTVGTGRQWISWIHIEDIVRLFAFSLSHSDIAGPVNCTSPQPVRMEQLGKTIAKVMNRPHWLPAPSFALQLLLGEMSDLILKGQAVIPQKALVEGFTFHYSDIEKALSELLVTKT